MKQRLLRIGLAGLGAAAMSMSFGCQGSGAFATLQQNLGNLNDQQAQILAKLQGLDQKVDALSTKLENMPAAAAAAPGKDRPPAGPQPGKPDPSATFKVAVADDDNFKGPKDAKITIVEWSDFQ